MRGAVFAYHAQNCEAVSYETNDHIALERDLAAVTARGLPIVSLRAVADALVDSSRKSLPRYFVAFSCDDGTHLDWRDFDHPTSGFQRGLANIVRDHASAYELPPRHLLTAFVIASPEARAVIDARCYQGIALSNDDWWLEAAADGLVAIENHSWDHVHEALPAELQRYGKAGDFRSVNDFPTAERQVRLAKHYIDSRIAGSGHRTSLFAYPYGHCSDYLARDYLPKYGGRHGVDAAFSTEKEFVDLTTGRYNIPRLVHGDAWRSEEDFEQLLTRLVENGEAVI